MKAAMALGKTMASEKADTATGKVTMATQHRGWEVWLVLYIFLHVAILIFLCFTAGHH